MARRLTAERPQPQSRLLDVCSGAWEQRGEQVEASPIDMFFAPGFIAVHAVIKHRADIRQVCHPVALAIEETSELELNVLVKVALAFDVAWQCGCVGTVSEVPTAPWW